MKNLELFKLVILLSILMTIVCDLGVIMLGDIIVCHF